MTVRSNGERRCQANAEYQRMAIAGGFAKLRGLTLLIPAILGLGLLSACGSKGKFSPNEFEVVSRAPLVVPPEAHLSPPKPGEPRAQEIDPGRQAFEALFPGQPYQREAVKSKSEQDLLSLLAPSDPDVRSNVGQLDLDVVKKRLILAEILAAEDRQFAPDNVKINRTAGR